MIYTFVTKAPLSEQITRELNSIPGIKAMHRRVHCPDNACFLATSILDAWRVEYEITGPKDVPEPLNSLQDLVSNGLREWVPDFLTPYQRDGIKEMAGKSGLMIWAAGCLAGDTVIAPMGLTIRELYLRRHEGAFPLSANSVDDHVPKNAFKNIITDVVYSGRKELFEVTITRQARAKNPKVIRKIKATADHGFLVQTIAGPTWMRLGDIVPGAKVYIVDDNGKTATGLLRAPKSVGIDHTYDICMLAPFHNFIANGIVVHNSGKTLASICWALHTPGKTVLCTRAPVRKSHGREIEKYTTKRAFVVEGEASIDFRERDEDFIVLGYETLPAHIDNLIKWRPINLILDECHKIKSSKRYSASPREDGTVQFQMLDNIASAAMRLSRAVNRTLGTSVGPDSRVEFKGGPFGTGWSGSIEEAFSTASGSWESFLSGDYEVIKMCGVTARGFDGKKFGWFPVKSIIRHPAPDDGVVVRGKTQPITLTNDHSMFIISREKNQKIIDVPSSQLEVGDRFVADDGNDWGGTQHDVIDVPSAVSKWFPDLSAFVTTKLEDHHRDIVNPSNEDWRRYTGDRGIYGTYLPIGTFMQYRDQINIATHVYCRKSSGGHVFAEVDPAKIAYILGYYLGNGWTDGKSGGPGRLGFVVNKKVLSKVKHALETFPFGNLNIKIRKETEKVIELGVTCAPLVACIFEMFGGKTSATTKKIPNDWIFNWPKDSRENLLNGLVDSDGHIRPDGTVTYSTSSKDLADSVLLLLRSLGIVGTHLRVSTPGSGGRINGRKISAIADHYKLTWVPQEVSDLREINRNKITQVDDFFVRYARLHTKEEVKTSGYVYDISMEYHPSFVANGLLAHNTATPVKNRVQDLWAQLDLCQPGEWGPFFKKDATSWAKRYCAARPGAFGGIDTSGSSNLDELWDRVSVISNQVAYSTTHRDLPPKRRVVTYVPQSEQVRATGFQKEFKAAAKGGAVSMMEVRLMEAAAKKRKYVLDILSDSIEAKHKVVVFTGRRADCDKLGEDVKALMEKLDPSGTVLVGHGGVASSERDQMQQTYMSSPGPCILIGTGDAWGEGVNLNDSDLHLIVMLPYTPGQVIQWEGRCCIAKGQPTITKRGVVPIEDVVVGDYVWSHKGRWCRVLDVSSKLAANKHIYMTDIEYMHSSLPLRCTSDHRIWVERRDGSHEWIESQHVRPGDYLLLARGTDISGPDPVLEFPEELRKHGSLYNKRTEEMTDYANGRYKPFPECIDVTKEVAYLFGAYLGDGWARTDSNGGRRFGISGNDTTKVEMLNRCEDVIRSWGIEPKRRCNEDTHSVEVLGYSADGSELMAYLFGQGSENKRVPECVFTWPRSHIESFIEGYFRADGSKKKCKDSFEWNTVSKHIGFQIPLLLAMIGRVGTCAEYSSSSENNLNKYYGQCSSNPREVPTDKYVKHLVRSVTNGFSKKDEHGVRERIYDIEVEGDESFTVGLAAVHNCRLGMKRPVMIQYLIAENTVDEHVAGILVGKLPAVEQMVGDDSVNGFGNQLLTGDMTEEEFMDQLLGKLGLTSDDANPSED